MLGSTKLDDEIVYQVKSSRKYFVEVTEDYKVLSYYEELKYINELVPYN